MKLPARLPAVPRWITSLSRSSASPLSVSRSPVSHLPRPLPKPRRAAFWSASALLAVSILLPLSRAFSQPSDSIAAAPSAQAAPVDAAVVTRLNADIAALTQFPSRAPGTAGNTQAAAYVEKRMREIGLAVSSDSYNVTAPVTTNGHSTLTLNGQSLTVFPIYPNGVVPSSVPTGGLSAPLIYARGGQPSDFNGLTVKGAIVALDFNSGMNWITAADLGARAVVFLEPQATEANSAPTSRGEAERKFAAVSAEMPRFYAPKVAADAIRGALGNSAALSSTGNGATQSSAANALSNASQNKIEATLQSQVSWQSVPVRNILGRLQGSDPTLSKQVIVIDSYYDSMAITPDLAPGAEAAGNCAAFLEMARSFKANPPKYSLLFVANGAHHLALAGARNFLNQHFVDSTGKGAKALTDEIASYRAFVGLDFTSRTDTVGLFAKAAFYNQLASVGNNQESILLNQFNGFAKTLYEDYAQPEAKRRGVPIEAFYVDGIRGLNGRNWRSFLPSLVALDSEAATLTGKPSVSFATANDIRTLQDTPFDLPSSMNVPNVARQIATVQFLLGKALNSGENVKDNNFQALTDRATKLSAIFGYGIGRAISRDVTKGKISFLPDTPVPNAVGYILNRAQDYKTYSGVRGAFIEKAQYTKETASAPSVAQFSFIAPRIVDPNGGAYPDAQIEAYGLSDDGKIVYAPDQGSEKARFSATFNKTSVAPAYKDEATGELNPDATTLCFHCRGVALYDTLDQRYFQVLTTLSVLDGQTDAEPTQYGFLQPTAVTGQGTLEPIAVVYGPPSVVDPKTGVRNTTHLKVIMAQGLLGKRLVLLNTLPSSGVWSGKVRPNGVGVDVPQIDDPVSAVVPTLSFAVARDLWQLDQQRIHLLKQFGISNQRVDALHGAVGCGVDSKIAGQFACPTDALAEPNGGAIQLAATALQNKQFDQFYAQSRRAFGLESRAYPDVEATAQDVLKGILFYLALLLPFSFFLERILFGFPDIRKQIMGTGGIFLVVFALISQVHPAFQLASAPFIILLAFIILALTVVVTSFLSTKFEAEIKRMKQGVHFADVGRLSAIGAALGLGVANMRRRPTRTALTCVTLILLTFTVLSFTSVTAGISNFARVYSTRTPSYTGMMVRQPDWSAMDEAAVTSMRSEFTQRFGPVALRAWYLSRDPSELLQLRVNNSANSGQYFYAPALVGLTPEEKTIGSPLPGTLTTGRWFQTGDHNVCIMPLSMLQISRTASDDTTTNGAAATSPLGLTPQNALGQSIQVAGQTLQIIGVFDDSKWSGSAGLRDLDDEPFTPVDYQNQQNKQAASSTQSSASSGQAPQVQSYQHMDATALLLIPYDTAISLGATTRSVAAGLGGKTSLSASSSTGNAGGKNATSGEDELQALMQRAALGIFGATPDKNGRLQSKLYSSVESTSYEGFASLVIPIAIAAMIIANTMLGSVFERTREIGIYSSIGLAPIHVAALFISEAGVYAVLGSISGYLVAQTFAKIATATHAFQYLTFNYSSSSAVIATLIVMATVLLSTLYPAFQASRLAQPDDRRWELAAPNGDLWRIQFPFTVSGSQPLGVAQFLADFFETHTDTSVGGFYTDRVSFSAMRLAEARALLDAPLPGTVAALDSTANGANGAASKGAIEYSNGAANGAATTPMVNAQVAGDGSLQVQVPENVALGHDDMEVYRLALRIWLAPFDMGVSQDADILLMPSQEEGLYEMQLRLVRRSGETSAWQRVNRGFIGDLRRQLLLWRTIKPEVQRAYIQRGRVHVRGELLPGELPAEAPTSSVSTIA